MSIDKINIIIAHAILLQIWAYEHVVVVKLVGLSQVQ